MNHDKQQRVAEETAISERFVRRVNPFRQVFPHQQLNHRVTDKTGSVQANACIPGVFEKISITNPIRKEKKTTFVRELPTGIFSMK